MPYPSALSFGEVNQRGRLTASSRTLWYGGQSMSDVDMINLYRSHNILLAYNSLVVLECCGFHSRKRMLKL